jgi:predicted RNA-binding protein with PUA domain
MEGSETGGGRRMVYTCRKCGLPKKGHQCLALAQDEQGGKHLNDNIAVRGGDGEIHAIKEIKRRSRKKRNEDEEEEEEDARNNEEGLEDEGVNERGAHGFKHFVVLDLEATCDEDYNRNFFPQVGAC